MTMTERLLASGSEHGQQTVFVNKFERIWPEVFIHSIPNGGRRSGAEGAWLKAEGMRPGVPDLFVPEWKLYIEMKKAGGTVSPAQKAVHKILVRAGYIVVVCYGCDDALEQCRRHRLGCGE